ncbi:LuxR C-terminal-related transcriptional regulator [Kribbella sp. NPDC058693]|uniref:helix-turn-helix transcriptional regulator n=1 Tax=Kribbella sp. NPDC058693 TaxID=3346602 RepID=UPI0036578C70
MNGQLSLVPVPGAQKPAYGGIAELLASAQNEVVAMSTLTPAAPAVNPREVRRGVRYRAIHPDRARTTPALGRHLGALSLAGVAVRTIPRVPMDMIVVDGSVVVLPADTGNGNVAVLRLTSVVTTALELFERIWPDAVPLAGPELPDRADLSVREQEMLRLLALGATDELVAAHLDISVRTTRRIVARVMNRLGARSRFQAGVKAADRGWLPVDDGLTATG